MGNSRLGDTMPLDRQTIEMHINAVEGGVFYRNELASKANVDTYFPKLKKKENLFATGDSKVSFPITADILHRVVSMALNGISFRAENENSQAELDELLDHLSHKELARDIALKSLYGGASLCTIPYDETEKRATVQTFRGEYAFSVNNTLGLCFLDRDGEMVPVTSESDTKSTKYREIPITQVSGYPVPAVLFPSIDKDYSSVYGLPFHFRIKTSNIEYNQVYSHVAKCIKYLSSQWTINKNKSQVENAKGNLTVEMGEDTVLFIGEDAELKQVGRSDQLTAEFTMLEVLKLAIANSAQVPTWMTGLKDVEKTESGVNLYIRSGPLVELIKAIRGAFGKRYERLVSVALFYDRYFTGRPSAVEKVKCEYDEAIIPIDQEAELRKIETADKLGSITEQEKRRKILPILGIEETPESEKLYAAYLAERNAKKQASMDSNRFTISGDDPEREIRR